MKRKLGLAALTVLELSPPEQVSVAAEAGYDCVGLRLIPAAQDGRTEPVFGATPVVLETLARLKDSALRVLDIEIFRLDPEVDVRTFEPFLETGALLGATQMLVAGADPDEARLADNFAALCDLSARFGLTPNLEPMPWLDVNTVAKARRILDLAARKNSGVLVDAIHFFREANDLKGLSSTRTNYVQLCDAPKDRPSDMKEILRQARSDRLMPGEGGLDLRGLLAALPPDLPICLEIPYAKPMSALERAKLALSSTRNLLQALVN